MADRSDALQAFVDAAFESFDHFAQDARSRRSIAQIFAALKKPVRQQSGVGSRLPVCSFLEGALATAAAHPDLKALVGRFEAIEPSLTWTNRPKYDGTASDNFADGHANAMIVGPHGLEDRKDVWIGVSLLAPNVRYPDHHHAPEETYLVLSQGEFQHGDSPWFSPGIGGSFYNEPGIRHAMRSLDTPLLAFWILLEAIDDTGGQRGDG
ncbi:dimethylsulfoniopropionate lyase [Manganibacter manganicus]|uniref:Transcriptional regulator n=1 Tax=Manganibacter manganicus TaxID=1873176 RepID=A0A1V8RT34_9HYPH|nr:dimethylsulfoniopropionate lyase [Pseudaminobacter manganicus]OQM76337.1 transcriptional regulator [Pseudaminobacter manganicus]